MNDQIPVEELCELGNQFLSLSAHDMLRLSRYQGEIRGYYAGHLAGMDAAFTAAAARVNAAKDTVAGQVVAAYLDATIAGSPPDRSAAAFALRETVAGMLEMCANDLAAEARVATDDTLTHSPSHHAATVWALRPNAWGDAA